MHPKANAANERRAYVVVHARPRHTLENLVRSWSALTATFQILAKLTDGAGNFALQYGRIVRAWQGRRGVLWSAVSVRARHAERTGGPTLLRVAAKSLSGHLAEN